MKRRRENKLRVASRDTLGPGPGVSRLLREVRKETGAHSQAAGESARKADWQFRITLWVSGGATLLALVSFFLSWQADRSLKAIRGLTDLLRVQTESSFVHISDLTSEFEAGSDSSQQALGLMTASFKKQMNRSLSRLDSVALVTMLLQVRDFTGGGGPRMGSPEGRAEVASRILSELDSTGGLSLYRAGPRTGGRSVRAESLFAKGLAALTSNDNSVAELLFDSAVALEPSSGGFNNLGLARLRSGDADAAVAAFRRAIWTAKTAGDSFDGFNNKGVSERKLRRFADAEADYSAAILADPSQRSIAYLNLGNLFCDRKDYKKAESCLTLAISADSSHRRAYVVRGQARGGTEGDPGLGDWRGAIDDFGMAIRLDSSHGNVYVLRGEVYLSHQMLLNAESDFRHAIRLDSMFALAHVDLGNLLRQRGRRSEANAEYAKVLGIHRLRGVIK